MAIRRWWNERGRLLENCTMPLHDNLVVGNRRDKEIGD